MPASPEHIYNEILVLKSQQGDVGAFEELIHRYQNKLWRHAYRLTGNQDAAWDCLQEAFFAISRGINRLEIASAFNAWAYQITSNKCYDWIRREARDRKAEEEYEDLQNGAANASIPSEQKVSDEIDRLKAALAKLPGKDRALLSLRYEENFEIELIAHILQIPQGTVKSRLHYAREKLRQIMEDTKNGYI